jgi:hypothetical protein
LHSVPSGICPPYPKMRSSCLAVHDIHVGDRGDR